MKRFKNIDCCKGIALLFVLIYHYWVLSGSVPISIIGFDTIILLGGEIGVTMFFVLSGVGIYCLLKSKETVTWFSFIKSRITKIIPLYYISILFVIGLTPTGASYLSKSGFWDIVTHILLIHNFFGRFHGTINGVLWTMGVIFQYYLIALPLYKYMQKNKHFTVLLSILFTVVCKTIVYKYILRAWGLGDIQYFVYGRQLFTALDNFVIGMYIGDFIICNKKKITAMKGILCLAVLICILILWGRVSIRYGVYVDKISGYLWHSVLAIIIAGIIVIFGMMKELNYLRGLQMIGKNEYGIYLLHFPILQNMLQSSLFQQLNMQNHYITACFIFLLIAFMIGYVFNRVSDVFRKQQI